MKKNEEQMWVMEVIMVHAFFPYSKIEMSTWEIIPLISITLKNLSKYG
jgi:hypothetical protein